MGLAKKLLAAYGNSRKAASRASSRSGRFRKLGKNLGETTQVTPGLANNELPEMVMQKAMQDTMKNFLKYSKEKFEKSVLKYDVRHEGDLYESFRTRVSGQSQIEGSLRFNFYGRFVDMGVGKGVTLIEKQTGRGLTESRNPSRLSRREKPWFTSVWGSERHRFAEVVARDAARVVSETVPGLLPSGDIPLTI